jgi:ribosomal protein S18 acetylase RimI-like enzyme
MRRSDIPFAVRLTGQERWGIPATDVARILHLNPWGNFIAIEKTQRVGLITTMRYGRQLAWIGNVVVKREFRGRHIGRRLVDRALDYLSEKKVKHIALYCFKENVQFYEKLGFVRGSRFGRWRRERKHRCEHVPERPVAKTLTLSSLLALDRKAFGADRRELVKLILSAGSGWYSSFSSGSSASYILVKSYKDMYELGPWISFGLGQLELESLLQVVLSEAVGRPIEVSCPISDSRASLIMKKYHFQPINDGRVMFHEKVATIGRPESIIAHGFLDKG